MSLAGGVNTALVLLALSAVSVIAMSWREPLSRPIATVMIIPAVGCLLVATSSRDLRGRSGRLTGRVWTMLGKWSFALYLLSGPVLGLAERLLPLYRDLAGIVAVVLLAVSAWALAGVAHTWFERPLEKWLRHSARRSRSVSTNR
ncbi:hypothetical protein ACFQ46_08120 [Kineococcus sp. GCM10028916]